MRRIDAETDVKAANAAFYEAFEARDMDAMSEVWEHSDRVVCTHPGWQALRWDLEELRVSLFAQELGAKPGVSVKRLARQFEALRTRSP